MGWIEKIEMFLTCYGYSWRIVTLSQEESHDACIDGRKYDSKK